MSVLCSPRTALLLLLLASPMASVHTAQAQVPLPEVGAVYGSQSAALSQDVLVSVSEINEFSVSSGTATVTIGTAAIGGGTAQEVNTGTTYALTTNGSGKKITGSLSLLYSTGISLDIELAAPGGATATPRTLSTTAQDLVTGVTRVATGALVITYTATIDSSAEPNADGGGETRTVTFTLTDS